MHNQFGNDVNYTLYQQDEQDNIDSSYQDELYFEIKLSKYPQSLELVLTFDDYKSQFKKFIHKYQLTRQQSLALKQIVRERIAQQLQRQQQKNCQRQKAQQVPNQSLKYGYKDQLPYLKAKQTLKVTKINYLESTKEKTTKDQALIYQNLQKDKSSNKFSKFKPHSKKLFATQLNTQLKQHSLNNFNNSLISSIHSKSNSQSQGSIDQKNPKISQDNQKEHKKQQKFTNNHYNYIEQLVNDQQHVSFNGIYSQKKTIDIDNNDMLEEEFQAIPKGINKGNIQKEVPKTKKHQNNQFNADNFGSNSLKNNQTKISPLYLKKSLIKKKPNSLTPEKNNLKITPYACRESIQPSVKKNQVKQVPQSAKVEPNRYNKDSTIEKKTLIKSQQKSIYKTEGKFQNSNAKNDKEMIREVFYRLYRQQTASSIQRQKPQGKEKSPQQKQDQKVVYQSLMAHRKKYLTMGEEQRQDLFTKLYLTSTESSMNRKSHFQSSNNYSNQIEHIINESNKKNQLKNSESFKKIIKKPDLTSPVYSYMQKRCNAHCQKHQYEKKLTREGQMKIKREQEIKRKVRSRSKQQFTRGMSLSKSQYKTKIFGQCQCCHKQKIDHQCKVKENLKKKNYKRSYNSNTKYSLEKRFLPTNISFISDVLQQSYNQLFPSNTTK